MRDTWPIRAFKYSNLIGRLGNREVTQRFKGSALGAFWLVIQPVLTIAVFYFVFVLVFKARWRVEDELPGQFVLSLFAGLIAYNVFSDIVGRSPSLILGNVNFVKKVVFPLDALSLVSIFPSLITAGVSVVIWVGLYMLVRGQLPDPSALMTLPLLGIVVLYALAASWFFAALCVYIRDVAQAVPVALQALIYASPVLYPLDRVPEGFLRTALMFNPLTIPIEAIRAVSVDGTMPSYSALALSIAMSVGLSFLGHAFFMKARVGFADVL